MRLSLAICSLLFTLLVQVPRSVADDWPQWLGPQRDSVWREEGIVDHFPADGLPVKWSMPVAVGYSGPAVADGRVFLCDFVKQSGEISNTSGGRDKLEGIERVLCFNSNSGKLLWKHEYDCKYNISYPGGPRCTPTVDGDRVYTLGAEGDLYCFDVHSGKPLWKKNFNAEYREKTPHWGDSAHPLVDGDRLFCIVGGEGSVAVAFNKFTGQEIWRALSAREPGYCPPTMIHHAGVDQLVIWHPEAMNGLDPQTGKLYWSVPLAPNYGMSIAAPRKQNDLLFASGIGHVGALFQLGQSPPSATVVWRGTSSTAVYCANSTPILDNGVIYGCDCMSGALVAARLEDGERLWKTFEPTTGDRRAAHGTAFLIKHHDRYFLFNEKGDLILARLSPTGYQEIDRSHILEPTNNAFGRSVVWSHPAFAERCLFARNDKELVCVSLAASSQ